MLCLMAVNYDSQLHTRVSRIELLHGFFSWNLILRESAEAFMAQEKGLNLESLKYRFVSWYFLAGRPWGICLTLWQKIRNLVSS